MTTFFQIYLKRFLFHQKMNIYFFCKYKEFYGDKIAYYRILAENPKLSKYQIAYLKYMIFNHQELKEKILDFENLLGDLNKISPKDWEILNDI